MDTYAEYWCWSEWFQCRPVHPVGVHRWARLPDGLADQRFHRRWPPDENRCSSDRTYSPGIAHYSNDGRLRLEQSSMRSMLVANVSSFSLFFPRFTAWRGRLHATKKHGWRSPRFNAAIFLSVLVYIWGEFNRFQFFFTVQFHAFGAIWSSFFRIDTHLEVPKDNLEIYHYCEYCDGGSRHWSALPCQLRHCTNGHFQHFGQFLNRRGHVEQRFSNSLDSSWLELGCTEIAKKCKLIGNKMGTSD